MPTRIKLVRQRLVLAKMVLRVLQLIAAEYLETAQYGSVADDLVLLCAIFVGQAEGRPMSSSKLADFAGMPRPTVIRKLRELQTRHLVHMMDGKATLPADRLNADCTLSMIDTAAKSVARASAELSKMDAKGIAPGDKS
jgi:hypothetical protein